MTDRQLQEEHREWLRRMYPDQPVRVPLAGMVEEAGELLHAVLKVEQESIWGPEGRHRGLREKLEDAIGDCAIFCCSYCNSAGEEFRTDLGQFMLIGQPLTLAVQLVRIACCHAVGSLGYTWHSYIGAVKSVANALGVDFDQAVERTWMVVKERTRE